MADTLTKETTKMMITTLNLPFTDYKTKIKHYIRRRKWQIIWDMSPNNKLYEHQPTIKLEIAEPLPNRRQDIILCRILPTCSRKKLHLAALNYSQSVTYKLAAKNMRTFARKTTKQQPSPCFSKMYLPLR